MVGKIASTLVLFKIGHKIVLLKKLYLYSVFFTNMHRKKKMEKEKEKKIKEKKKSQCAKE